MIQLKLLSKNKRLSYERIYCRIQKQPPSCVIVFISDGGVSREGDIKRLLIESSKMPIFWQFVGIGGTGFLGRLFGGYGIFEKLSTLSGRYVDNANFFALDDFKKVDNAELYSHLLNEFPNWLKEIKSKGMI